MAEPIPADVTQLLGQWSGGDREALDEIIPLVYDELRRMAHGHMAHERAGHTIQATALVNEVYLKLKNKRGSTWNNRAQFFAIAAQMMRRILVDYARQHGTAKRGAGAQQVTLDDAMLVSKDNASEMLAIDAALQKLEQLDQRKSQVAVSVSSPVSRRTRRRKRSRFQPKRSRAIGVSRGRGCGTSSARSSERDRPIAPSKKVEAFAPVVQPRLADAVADRVNCACLKLHLENLPASLELQRASLARCLAAMDRALPLRAVYLFGSHARGDARPDSDVDLCLVAEGAKHQLQASAKWSDALWEVWPRPAFTLIPIAPARLAEKRANNDHFFATILKEGLVLATQN